jgi:5-methylcytosine-specific restriction endonuclease McrA
VIRLERPPEPEPLRRKRPGKVAAARDALHRGEKIDFSGYGDDGAKEDLFQGQHRKCAYCEKSEEQSKYREAEHYRPKSTYWWLAWTWENLLFACMDCNREHKKEQFPLVDEVRRLVAGHDPPGDEQPLLIDPYDGSVDPAREIEFRREYVQRRERWRPYGLTERGRETIRICGLDRPSLLTLYDTHVREVVRVKVERFRGIAETGSSQEIVRAWGTLVRGLSGAYQPFQVLSRDAVQVLVPPDIRARYHLSW